MIENLKLLEKFSLDLKVSFETQDWGIINADKDRVVEFILYFENKVSSAETIRFNLFELVIASFNEKILEENSIEPSIQQMFVTFINKYSHEFESITEYWKRIYDEEDFPVGKFFI